MDNKKKIEELEKKIKVLSKEYNDIREEWKRLGSTLDLRNIEISNKCKQVKRLSVALSGLGEHGK